MASFVDILLEVLKADERYFTEDGTLLRNKVYESALNMDVGLIELLLSNAETRKRFFAEVNGILVFDKVGFGWVVNNRQFLPDSYTRFKNRIGLTDSHGDLISASNDVVLSFPYKDCVLEGGQTKDDQKRDEVFYNATLAPDEVDRLLYPKVLVGARRYTVSGIEEGVVFNDKDNLIIKGNNLIAIASLLKQYEGKIKCIYIDPPYNPTSQANTFAYNNSFNRSTWLVFMKNRLEIAKRLLKKDGVLIVAIDKNEQPRLQILIEETFPASDVDCITVVHNARGAIGTNFSYTHEYAIFVTPKGKKSIGNRKIEQEEIDWRQLRDRGGESLRTDARNCFYPIIVENGEVVGFGDVCADDEHPKQNEKHGNQIYIYPIDNNGIERKWRYARQTVESIKNVLRIKETKDGLGIEIGKDYGTYKTVWTDRKYDASLNGTQLLKSILPNTKFTYPKSIYNVIDCVNAVVENDKDAIILDFFGGSGTTGHAVMEINKDGGHRRFILVEQMDYIETDTLPRNVAIMKSIAPEVSIVYCELAKCNQNYIDEVLVAKTDIDLAALLERVLSTGFISSKVNPAEIAGAAVDFEMLSIEDKKRFILELLDKNMLYVNLCDLDDEEYAISDVDKAFTRSFYGMECE
ncbi:adenine-specific DNA-methyltransferase [Cohnella sp. OV330]|uniref:site-specific DNA-methyltransferase n=1 Tax=Cohnella sp. OV330 TaxID=1855288 RepID=UPI0008EA3487|nr:site-specific DNA-methyltransferase [Cohnella sp. OV330]SFA75505.1 adenine-specific DNA-methyltransferase [Cohnella sp. OV330]